MLISRKAIARQAAGKLIDWLCDWGPLLLVIAVNVIITLFVPAPQP